VTTAGPDIPRVVSITLGSSATQTSAWADIRLLRWDELVLLLTRHAVGAKDGTCFTPATFPTGRRRKGDAARIDLLVLDSDSGASREDIARALRSLGWAGLISSTHSHLATETLVKRGATTPGSSKRARRSMTLARLSGIWSSTKACCDRSPSALPRPSRMRPISSSVTSRAPSSGLPFRLPVPGSPLPMTTRSRRRRCGRSGTASLQSTWRFSTTAPARMCPACSISRDVQPTDHLPRPRSWKAHGLKSSAWKIPNQIPSNPHAGQRSRVAGAQSLPGATGQPVAAR
jgi:hypothetical protein